MGITFGIGGGTLYFGDLNDPDRKPVEVKAGVVESAEIEPDVDYIESMPESFEVTFTSKLNRNMALSMMLGRRITNNWLKLHGGIMTRKRLITNLSKKVI